MKSSAVHMRYNAHRDVCATCFTHCISTVGAPLCPEGEKLRAEWLPLWNAEGEEIKRNERKR